MCRKLFQLELFLCLACKNGRVFNSTIKTFHLNNFHLFITLKKSPPWSPFHVFSQGKAWDQDYGCDDGPTGVPGPNHPSMFQWIRPWPYNLINRSAVMQPAHPQCGPAATPKGQRTNLCKACAPRLPHTRNPRPTSGRRTSGPPQQPIKCTTPVNRNNLHKTRSWFRLINFRS